MLAKQIQKNIDKRVDEFREETKNEKTYQWCVAFVAWAVTQFRTNEHLGDEFLVTADRSWVTKELDNKFKQAQLSLIETMIKCQKQEEQRLQMIKLKSYLGLSDEDIGIKMGELKQCRRTLDYLKAEKAIIEKI